MALPKGVEWSNGMSTKCGAQCIAIEFGGDPEPVLVADYLVFCPTKKEVEIYELDLTDPATIGCLEAQVEKKWSIVVLICDGYNEEYYPCLNLDVGCKIFKADTKVELYLAALRST